MPRPFVDPNDRYSYEDWMNDMATQEPELPPNGHPLHKLGERLAHYLDDDKFNECEALLLAGWDHDRIDRKTGQAWREDSSLEKWFPLTAEELKRLQSRVADLQQYHDWAEPQITGDRARLNIQLGIVQSLLDDPSYEPGPVDNEHWSPMHDELRAKLAVQPPADCGDCAPIAKLTVSHGLIRRAGLYAPGLPDGDHDVFPIPQPPAGELGWQPIETAPMDGRYALVYRPLAETTFDQVVDVKRLVGGNHHCWPCTVPSGQEPYNPTDGACHVTHWMPLPAPPAKREGQP